MTGLTIKEILEACKGEFHGDSAIITAEVSDIITDSRKAAPGCIFAAIPGERVDGHDFASDAANAGAVCCLCSRHVEGNYILVPSVSAALRQIAAIYRKKFDIPIIGVTGSVGKTTAKEMAACVLAQKFNTLKTQGNFNNELGVPLTLFRLEKEHQAAVVEMGISDFGEMTRLAEMVCPNMALFSTIGFSHLEFLHSREGVLKAKAEILTDMPDDGVVFINGDDDLLRTLDCSQKKISFGLGQNCDVRAEKIRSLGIDGMTCEIVSGDRRIPVTIPAFGVHMVTAALAGAAVGLYMGLSDSEISAGIESYQPVGRRSNATNTGFCTLIDDCYNSNPTSLASALASLAMLPNRKVCILGDMKELGKNERELHEELGRLCARLGVKLLITCGSLAMSFCIGAKGEENPPMMWHFPNKSEVLTALPHLLQYGDAVLVKASHSMGFDEISEAVKTLR